MSTATFTPKPGNGHPPFPIAPAMPETEITPGLGEVLSPSQAKTFLECPAKWYFKYLRGLPDPKSAALSLGKAVHQAIGANFQQKILTHQDLAPGDVVEGFSSAWSEEARDTEFRDEESATELELTGRAMVAKYMEEGAARVQPQAVELAVSGQIGGVWVRGFIDILDVDGMVIDLKTAAKKPSGIAADHRLQLTTYDLLCPASRGKAQLQTLTKNGSISYIPLTTEITPADVQYAETVYPLVQDAIKDGIFYPRRSSWMCSRKNCSFWRTCEAEYGGEVGQ
jgi:CRISPR/Cas system-associated exonuclease Cas4 (RecB family)